MTREITHIFNITGMAKGEYDVSDAKDNKKSENGAGIESNRIETVNDTNLDTNEAYVGYGFKKDESVNVKFNLPLLGKISNFECSRQK